MDVSFVKDLLTTSGSNPLLETPEAPWVQHWTLTTLTSVISELQQIKNRIDNRAPTWARNPPKPRSVLSSILTVILIGDFTPPTDHARSLPFWRRERSLGISPVEWNLVLVPSARAQSSATHAMRKCR